MKTLIISSSLSKNSKSFLLCKEVQNELLSKKARVTFVDARNILIAERVALNFLSHISGIASLTNKFVKLAGKKC